MGDVLAYSGALRRLAVEVGKVASRPAAAQHGPARRPRRDPAAAGAAGIVDHAGQGESVDAGDGQPGLLPGDRVRRRRSLAACEAGQLELNVMMPVIAWNALHALAILREAMRVLHDALRRTASGRRGAMPRAARSQHRARDGAQPVHRLRRDRGHRQDVGQDRAVDPRSRPRAAACCPRPSSTPSCRPKR